MMELNLSLFSTSGDSQRLKRCRAKIDCASGALVVSLRRPTVAAALQHLQRRLVQGPKTPDDAGLVNIYTISVAHLDLQPAIVLVNTSLDLKIADFSCAHLARKPRSSSQAVPDS